MAKLSFILCFCGLAQASKAQAAQAAPTQKASTEARVARICDSSILTDCTDLASAHLDASHDSSLHFQIPKDGGAIINELAYWVQVSSKNNAKKTEFALEQLKLNKASPARVKLALVTAERVRQAAITAVENGERPDAWSSEQKNLLARLRLLKIDPFENPHEVCGESQSPAGFANAGYVHETHTMYICAGAINATETQLISILGHEFGHVVSPCSMATTLFKMDSNRLLTDRLTKCMPQYIATGDKLAIEDDQFLNRWLRNKNQYAVVSTSLPIIKKLVACGIAKTAAKGPVQVPNFFGKTLTCLTQLYSPQYLKYVNDQGWQQSVAQGVSLEKGRSYVAALMSPQCTNIVEENFAESFKAMIVANVARDSHWSASDYQIAFLEMQGYNCALRQLPAGGRYEGEDYPKTEIRTMTVMNDPLTRVTLNCHIPKNAKLCPLIIGGAAVSTLTTTPQRQPPSKPAGAVN